MLDDFLYKFINLPNVDKIGEIIWRNLPDEIKFTSVSIYKTVDMALFYKCKPLVEAVETIRPWNELDQIAIVVVKPHGRIPIHTDLGEYTIPTKYALNFPIFNTDNCYTAFYKLNKDVEGPIKYQDHGDPYVSYRDEDVEEIDRMFLTNTAFFNTQVLHSVVNLTDQPRCAITLRFKTPFDFEKIFNQAR